MVKRAREGRKGATCTGADEGDGAGGAATTFGVIFCVAGSTTGGFVLRDNKSGVATSATTPTPRNTSKAAGRRGTSSGSSVRPTGGAEITWCSATVPGTSCDGAGSTSP